MSKPIQRRIQSFIHTHTETHIHTEGEKKIKDAKINLQIDAKLSWGRNNFPLTEITNLHACQKEQFNYHYFYQ